MSGRQIRNKYLDLGARVLLGPGKRAYPTGGHHLPHIIIGWQGLSVRGSRISCCPKLEAVKLGWVLFGSAVPPWLSSCGTMAESSVASTSRSCASTRTRLGKSDPHWPRSDSATGAMPSCSARKPESLSHCWTTPIRRACCLSCGPAARIMGRLERKEEGGEAHSDCAAT